ncbi:protein of unknown function [Methylorubrum extorquens]|uniref:Uncharacterized protein n=1 Tax=Methylorubrum extorquens TaxID=408 RepID=A0A2N9AKJ2_METEX|nr:protein of unknown function [Methylorubrum extorquens]
MVNKYLQGYLPPLSGSIIYLMRTALMGRERRERAPDPRPETARSHPVGRMSLLQPCASRKGALPRPTVTARRRSVRRPWDR